MNRESELCAALQEILPLTDVDAVMQLAQILLAAADRTLSSADAAAELSRGSSAALLKLLAGTEVRTDDSIVSFGKDNQFGEVTLRDVAGGNIMHINIVISSATTSLDKKTANSKRTRKEGGLSNNRTILLRRRDLLYQTLTVAIEKREYLQTQKVLEPGGASWFKLKRDIDELDDFIKEHQQKIDDINRQLTGT